MRHLDAIDRWDVCGKWERLAYERAQRDHAEPPVIDGEACWFDEEEADLVCEFFGELRHHKGRQWAGKPFNLQPWQRFCLMELFGWMRADGTRRFRTSYNEVPRKNGKTEMAAGVGLRLLMADGEPGAEVYSAATKKDQARLAFDAAKAMLKLSPLLSSEATAFRANIHTDDSKFEPLGADSNTMDGLNTHGLIADELHAHKDRHVMDVLTTSMGSRDQPLTYEITTAGLYDPESIGWRHHETARQVLEGTIEDETLFVFMANSETGKEKPNESPEWKTKESWVRANPNWDVSVLPSYMRGKFREAQRDPTFVNTFQRYHLNLWVQQRERWIQMDRWNACPEDEVDLSGRVCFAGLDLSSKIDLTSLALVFPPEEDDDIWHVRSTHWCPEDTVLERGKKDVPVYLAWMDGGHLQTTEGNVIDYDFIEHEVLDLAGKYDIKGLAYDPWNATQTAVHLQEDGLECTEMRQGYPSLTEPSKEFERLIISGRFNHGGDPVLRWSVNNVAKRTDPAGNIKPDKERSREKIDPVVAIIMALGLALPYVEQQSVYDTEDLLVL